MNDSQIQEALAQRVADAERLLQEFCDEPLANPSLNLRDRARQALRQNKDEIYPTDSQPEPGVTDKLEEQENSG